MLTSPAKSTVAAYSSPYKSPHKPRLGGEKEEEEDTRALLERMKETVEGMKRRRSEVPSGARMSVAPVAPLTVEEEEGYAMDDQKEDKDEGSDKENAAETDENESSGEEEEVEPDVPAPFGTPMRPTTMAMAKTPHLDLKHVFSAAQPPQTPSFKGVRELFAANDKPAPETPKMDGMRDMFRERKVLATPAFEGVGEMMSTPKGWKMDVLGQDDDAEDEHEKEEAENAAEETLIKSTRRGRSNPANTSAAKPPSTLKIPATATRRKTPRSTATTAKTPVTEGKSNFADDEATPGDSLGRVEEEDEENKGIKKPAVRKGRSRATPADSDAEEGEQQVKGKARLIRGSRKAVDDIPEVGLFVLFTLG